MGLMAAYNAEFCLQLGDPAVKVLCFVRRPGIGAGVDIQEQGLRIKTFLDLFAEGTQMDGNGPPTIQHVAKNLWDPA